MCSFNPSDILGINSSINKYNPSRKGNVLIVFNDVIADIISNKILRPTVTELFIRGKT